MHSDLENSVTQVDTDSEEEMLTRKSKRKRIILRHSDEESGEEGTESFTNTDSSTPISGGYHDPRDGLRRCQPEPTDALPQAQPETSSHRAQLETSFYRAQPKTSNSLGRGLPRIPAFPVPSRSSEGSLFDVQRTPSKVASDIPKWAREMMKSLQEVKFNQVEIMKQLEAIRVSKGSAASEEAGALPDAIKLPLTTVEELQELENLLVSPGVAKSVINNLKLVGGDSVKTTTTNCLYRLLGPKGLAEKICWAGSKGKMEFNSLRLRGILERAVRIGKPAATDVEIKRSCQDFFRNARDRAGGRKSRMLVPVNGVPEQQQTPPAPVD